MSDGSKLTLYSNYVNSAGERVRIALGLKGIDYDYVSVGQLGWAAYEKINPQRLMPALDIGGTIVAQATAILEYLEETYPEPALLPADPVRRALARGFGQHITSEMHAIDVIRVRRFLHGELGLDQAGIDRWQRHWFHTGFAALEELLRRREDAWPFCYGDDAGWADLHLIPQVRKGLTRFDVDMTPYPLIDAIYRRCADLPAFLAAPPRPTNRTIPAASSNRLWGERTPAALFLINIGEIRQQMGRNMPAFVQDRVDTDPVGTEIAEKDEMPAVAAVVTVDAVSRRDAVPMPPLGRKIGEPVEQTS